MKLALLAPLPPEQTGIADYAQQWSEALRQAGVQVSTPLLGQPALRNWQEARQWVSQQDWQDVDVVHAELGGGRLSEFFAMNALRAWSASPGSPAAPHRPRLSATVHDPERLVWRPVSRLWQALDARHPPAVVSKAAAVLVDAHTLWAERRLAQGLDGMVALTQTGANCLRQRMRLTSTAVQVIPHGVPIIAAAPLPPSQPVRLLYFGFIYPGKGIEDLIAAMAQLRAQHPELALRLRLTLAGGSAPEMAFGASNGYLDGLRRSVREHGLAEQVQWALDLPQTEIPALIQSHHALVLPYRESRKLALMGQMRGTSGALAWAIACGRGVICSDARSFKEEISHGNGMAVAAGDIDALAGAMQEVVREPQRLQQWAAAAQALAAQRAWPRIGEAFAAHFQELSQARAPTSVNAHAQAQRDAANAQRQAQASKAP